MNEPICQVPRIHCLKTWPPFFQAVIDKCKSFELRLNDRGFKELDTLHLREWNPETKLYRGRECYRLITYIVDGFDGLLPGYCILGIQDCAFEEGENDILPAGGA